MSNPWITRDIGRGPIGFSRTQKTTPGIIDINSRFDGVLVAQGPVRRRELKQIRKTLKNNLSIIYREAKTSQRGKENAKDALQDAIDSLNKVLKKKGRIEKGSLDRIRKKAENAIAIAERLLKYNTPPWGEKMLRYFLFEDLLEARKLYTKSVDNKNHPEEMRATKGMITEAVRPYTRAINLLRHIDAPEPPNGDTIFDGTYPAFAWPQPGDYNADTKSSRYYYMKLDEAISYRKRKIAQDSGGVWDHERALDEAMKKESDWFRALTAELTATDRQQINKYLKELWGKSAKLKTYQTQFVVDFKKDEVPPPEAIKQPADTK